MGLAVAKVTLDLGQVVITAHANEILTELDIIPALRRHASGDWGEVCNQDWVTNNLAVRNGGRILSAYSGFDGEKFWIITEADRSYTTVLFPEDY